MHSLADAGLHDHLPDLARHRARPFRSIVFSFAWTHSPAGRNWWETIVISQKYACVGESVYCSNMQGKHPSVLSIRTGRKEGRKEAESFVVCVQSFGCFRYGMAWSMKEDAEGCL